MKNVLVVKGNNRPDGTSTAMYNTFVENLDATKVNIDTFDVFTQDMPYIGQTLFDAFGATISEGYFRKASDLLSDQCIFCS